MMANMAQLPVAIVCVGMAGSGKTTFMQRINSYLHQNKSPPYVINLDPAVRNVPFESNIDIRDTINYKEVMKQYNLGPNGGIITSLNLFATKVDQIVDLLEKRTKPDPAVPDGQVIKHILVDTPGQMEVFAWSASGTILLDSIASTFPTVLAYIIDTPRTASTSTFMSNMLYAISILYKTKLPMVLVFNKTDVKDAEFAKEWMTDFEAFQTALREEEQNGSFGGVEGGEGMGGSGFMGSLLNSMSLTLDAFYSHLKVVSVSSMTGNGVDDFFAAVKEKAEEFDRDYRPELEKRRRQKQKQNEEKKAEELDKLMEDINLAGASKRKEKGPNFETLSELASDDEEGTGELVLPDSEEGSDQENAEEESSKDTGLTSRYKKALEEYGGSNSNPSGEDYSFARYVRKGDVG